MTLIADFTGQTALVTGGASGIGRAVARDFARAGARLIVADRDATRLCETVAELAALTPTPVDGVELDVTDSARCDAVVAQCLAARGGRLDVLVHSAGIGIERPFLDTTDAEWSRIIDTDLTGTFAINRAAGRVMAEAGYGRIVNLASTAGVAGGTGRAAYGAAKGGVIMLSRVLAVELAAAGVTVNALAPGAIETELVARMHSDTTRKVYRRAIPADRYGTPEEVSAAALFLASREAGYINGHVLAVDGGFLAAGVMHKD